MKNILITGGTGLTGSRLTEILLEKGYSVSHLSFTAGSGRNNVKSFAWNPLRNEIDESAFENTEVIIHLAGAGIADKRWTTERKKVLYESRVNGTALIYETLKKIKHKVSSVISASGTGYYGDTGSGAVTEEHSHGNDFLAKLCADWEGEAQKISSLGIRTAVVRTGIVLSAKGGAFPPIVRTVKWYIGAALGSGYQYFPWIHIDDLCGIYLKLLEDETMSGAFNGVAPETVTNKKFTKAVAETLRRPLLLPNVPAFALKIIFGEMADALLCSCNASADKIKKSGYVF